MSRRAHPRTPRIPQHDPRVEQLRARVAVREISVEIEIETEVDENGEPRGVIRRAFGRRGPIEISVTPVQPESLALVEFPQDRDESPSSHPSHHPSIH